MRSTLRDPSARTTNEAIEVSVLGARDEFSVLDQEAWCPVEARAFEVRGPRAFGYCPGLLNRLTAMDPDLVHVHGLWQYCSVAAWLWHSRTTKPYIVSPHGMLDPWALAHSRWKKRLGWLAYERNHLNSAACIRALCEAEFAAIRAVGLKNPICIIPNGVDLPELAKLKTAQSDQSAGAKPDLLGRHFDGRKLLLYLGRIHPKKGLSNLVRAWSSMVERPDDWLLVIAGWDQAGHELELKRLAGKNGVDFRELETVGSKGASIVFAGAQYGPAKRAWLSRCDASILPSFSEGLPMAVLEAWSFGKPVLATPRCNVPEGFANGAAIQMGHDVEEIAEGLRILFGSSGSELKERGARGRWLAETQFSWDKIALGLRSVYQWLAGDGPRPTCVR